MPTIKLKDAIRLGIDVPNRQTFDGHIKAMRAKRGTGATGARKALLLTLKPGVETRPGYLRAVLPIKTQAEKNNSEHWRSKQSRVRLQKKILWNYLARFALPRLPAHVKFTRYGKRRLDDDNTVGAVSHLRDHLAELYGVNDGRNSPLTFDPSPGDVVAGDYFVTIEIISSPTGSEARGA